MTMFEMDSECLSEATSFETDCTQDDHSLQDSHSMQADDSVQDNDSRQDDDCPTDHVEDGYACEFHLGRTTLSVETGVHCSFLSKQ